jgi:hypothetical protein
VNIVNTIAYALATLTAVFLLGYYFLEFKPKISMSTKGQLWGIIFIMGASVSFMIQAILYWEYGPRTELDYYSTANWVHGCIIFFFNLYYPLAISGFTLQVVTWVEFSFKVKMVKSKYRELLVRVCFGIGISVLILFNLLLSSVMLLIGNWIILRTVLFAYIGVFLAALLIFTVIFGLKMLKVVWAVRKSNLVISSKDGTSKSAISEATIRMGFLVFISVAILLLGALVAIFTLPSPYNNDANWYFGVYYAAMTVQIPAVFSIQINFLWMMRSTLKTNPQGKTFGGSSRERRASRASTKGSRNSKMSQNSQTSQSEAVQSGQLSLDGNSNDSGHLN